MHIMQLRGLQKVSGTLAVMELLSALSRKHARLATLLPDVLTCRSLLILPSGSRAGGRLRGCLAGNSWLPSKTTLFMVIALFWEQRHRIRHQNDSQMASSA